MLKQNYRLIAVLSILLVTGFLVTSLASFFVSRASLRSQISQNALPLTSDNIYSEIQRDLFMPVQISSLMATDTFLRDWVISGEHDSSQLIRYLKDIQQRYNTFTSFFVSEKTRNYYQADRVLKKVYPTEPRDEWYFRVRNMRESYEINVDPDMAHDDTMTIFVNYRVFDYDGNYIGATGVGLAVTAVKELINNYQEKYDRNIFFTDNTGRITLYATSFTGNTTNINECDYYARLANQIYSSETNSLEYKRNGNTIYLITRYIPELDWYLFVEQSDEAVMHGIYTTLFANLLICFLITSIVVTVTGITVSSYQKRMETLATIDKLTGLYNRQAFDIILDNTIRDMRRSEKPLSMIWFDIDRFKLVNDTYGHIVGDRVLNMVANLGGERLRDSDIISRWGGEEFIVLLKNCDLENAFDMAEKIRLAIAGQHISHNGNDIAVTVSLGVGELDPGEDKSSFLIRTDTALFNAKKNGRNRTEKA